MSWCSFKNMIEYYNVTYLVNSKRGPRMEIAICKTQKYMYYGERNDTVEKEGWGIVYDEEGGKMVLEGIWSKGILIEVIRCFVGDTMTEWKRNEKDSLYPLKRIPL